MKINKNVSYNDIGQSVTITIQTNYDDLQVIEFPESCYSCPVGFQNDKCGRNYPYKPEDSRKRPDTCKLQKVNLDDLLTD